MDFQDYQKDKPAFIAQLPANSKARMNNNLDSHLLVSNEKDDVVVSPIGQVKRMLLPKSWQEAALEARGSNNGREYCLKSNPKVKIVFYYQGPRPDDDSAKSFKSLLLKQHSESEPHVLSPQELQSVSGTIGNQGISETFELRSARVLNLNGRAVLEVEGKFKSSGLGVLSLFVDADSSRPGQIVQEIYFEAPEDPHARKAKDSQNMYDANLAAAQGCFNTIIWTDSQTSSK